MKNFMFVGGNCSYSSFFFVLIVLGDDDVRVSYESLGVPLYKLY